MNRIVREHYPVSQLPEDLQQQLQGQQSVTVTLAWGDDPEPGKSEQVKPLEELFATGASTIMSLDAVASHIRSFRND